MFSTERVTANNVPCFVDSRKAAILVASLLFAAMWLFQVSTAQAQITDVTNSTSTPIPGAGHDYIKLLNESVNPANGSVSLRIQVPTPPGRRMSLPFAFAYDSNSAQHLVSWNDGLGGIGWLDNAAYLGKGGWSYSVPTMTALVVKESLIGGHGGTCVYTSNFVFQDETGGRHSLYLSVDSSTPYNCGFAWPIIPVQQTTGGDDYYRAAVASNQPALVASADGTVYKFTAWGEGGGHRILGSVNTAYSSLVSSIEDRNGNLITVRDLNSQHAGSFNATDTLGRTILSSSGFGTTGDTIAVAGLTTPYTVIWETNTGGSVPVSTKFLSNPLNGCNAAPPLAGAETVIKQITLPNGSFYSFSYDPNYGLLKQITYPNGGFVSYTYTLNSLSDFESFPDGAGNPDFCQIEHDTPAVFMRTVSFDGVNIALQQTFSYSTVWGPNQGWSTKTTTVDTVDNISGLRYTTKYTYTPYTAQRQPNDYSMYAPQIPVESTIVTKDSSGSTQVSVAKEWYDEYELKSQTTTLANNKTSKTTYAYGPGAQITERDDFDYGSGVPARKVVTTYQPFAKTPIFPSDFSIFDRPCKVVTYDGGGNSVAETDFLYDDSTTLCLTGTAKTVQSVSGLPTGTHDDTNYAGNKTPPRGNVTTKTQWSNVGPSSVTTYKYDATGQLFSTTDPCGNASCSDMSGTGHTTTFSYGNSFTVLSGSQNVTYTPSANMNAYLTLVKDALGYTSKFTYDFNNGQLTASRDQNDINAGRAGTTYLYNDPLARPKVVTNSDGGTTSYDYNDSLFDSNANTPNVKTTKAITSGVSEQTIVAADGLGHVVRTILNSDPEGADITDTTYNGLGWVWKVSNPYRSTPNGTTINTYDVLGRTISVTKPDGSVAGTSYDQTSANTNGTCSTSTDEALNKRFSCTDGLGRLIEVDEPGSASAGTATPATGSFSVAGNEQSAIVGPPTAGTGSVSVAGTEQSWQTQTAPATSSSGSVTITGSLQSKQVQTQAATSGAASISVAGGPDQSKTINPCQGYGNCPQTIWNTGTLSVTVNGVTSSVSYDQNSTLASLAPALGNGLNGALLNGSGGSSGGISVSARATGASTNYGFSTSATWMSSTCPDGNPCFGSSPFYFYPTSGALSGGRDAVYTTVYDHGTTSITINGQPVSYSWSGSGTTSVAIAQGLASAVNSSSSYATASASGSTVYLTSRSAGASVNYSLSSSSSYDTGNFSSPSFGAGNSGGSMVGGADAQYITNWDSGTISVTVNGHTTSYNWAGSGTSSDNIATGLIQAINGDSSAVVNASPAGGSTVNLASRTAGQGTNYSFSTSTTSQRSSFSSSTGGGAVALMGGTDGHPIFDTGTASVTVGSFTATASYGSGSTQSSLASALAAAFGGSGIIATASGTTVSLTTSQTGSAANLPLSATSATSQPGTFSTSFSVSPAGTSLTGGTEAGTPSLSTAAITLYGYDALNNLVCVVQNTGGPFTTTYSNCPNASATWRPRWFQYDSLSRLWNAHNPESGNLAYSYDVNGNVSSKTDARSITVNYSYDSINRLIQKKYGSTVAASYGYDGVAGPANCPPALSASNPIGKRTSMCDAAGTESWSYPLIVGKGWQVVDKRTTNGVPETITTQNNFDGSVGTITYPSARVVSYSYSGAARPVSVTDTTNGINYVANATYAPFGGLTGMKNGNSITVTNSYYESRMQPHVLSASGAAGIILSQVYDFHVGNGDNGNVYQIANGKDPNRTQNFTYDALNRIAEAWSSGPQWGERFTTDGWSNLKSRDQIPGKTNYEPLSAPINNYNQLTGYGYDAAGNMTSNGGANYTYDAESRLSTAGGLTYTYDGDGNRVVKSGSTIYWGIGPLAESDLSGTLQHEYIFFAGKRVARLDLPTGSPNYYFENHIGSTSVVTDASGQCEQDIDYYPYGGVQSDNCSTPISQNYKFTGKERDTESGLDYFGARHYASNLGRFMVPDWAAKPTAVPYATFGNPQSLNLYSYVENNPVSRVDPLGHATEAVWYDSGGFGDPSFMGATDFETDAANQMAAQPQAQNNAPRLGIGIEVPANSAVQNNTLDVTKDPGHAFVYLKDSSGHISSTLSFGPGDWIQGNLTAFQNGQLPGRADWPITGSVSTWESTITSAQFATGTKAIADFKGNVPNYTMAFNCTTGALSIAQKAGLTLPSGVGPVTALGHNQNVANPYHLSQQMRSQFGPPQIVGASVFAPPKW